MKHSARPSQYSRSALTVARSLALCLLLAAPAGAGEPASSQARQTRETREAAQAEQAGEQKGLAAPGGKGLLEAMERGALPVVGRIGQIERLDLHSYRASIWVERILGPRSSEHPEGAAIRIAWEELATGRPPRFAQTDRALVCIERLGTASIWRKRIPDPSERRQTRAVANDSGAFLRRPARATLDGLDHYLALAGGSDTSAGASSLVALLETASLPIAIEAAQRLLEIPDLHGKLEPASGQALVRALLRAGGEPVLTESLLPVFAAAGSETLADALAQAQARERELALDEARSHGEQAPSILLFEAAAQMPGGLPDDDLSWLLAQDQERYRLTGARYARSKQGPNLRKLLASDPAPAVRAEAVIRLVALDDDDALPLALGALADGDPRVRSAASRSAASLGARGATGLAAVAYGTHEPCAGSADAPRAAIAGLSQAGSEGRRALREIARQHPDESLRGLARMALGSASSDGH